MGKVSGILQDPVTVLSNRTHQGVEGSPFISREAGADPFFPLVVDGIQERCDPLTLFREEEPDGPSVTGVGNPPDIPGILEFPDCPGDRALVEMVVPYESILHDVLHSGEQYQDRELAGREAQRAKTVVEKDEPAAAREGYPCSEGDRSTDRRFHVHQ